MKNLDYDSISPITGNKCVVEEANEHDNTVSYLCMESGFTSHEKLIQGTEFQEKYEKHLTDLMISCKTLDDENRAWYPTFLQLPGGMLYCEGKSQQSWSWKVAQIIPIIGDERLNYPVPGKENEYHTSRLDVENAKTYNKNNFNSALDELYTIAKKEHIQ
jgi:hypothetical protein|tara:strand:+ start:287 stop:766 length:480 start_codon:yes stop_codon:yes gene_type:complete